MPFSKLRAPSAGFTLIELLVVITILMILLGGAIAGFLTFSDNQKVFTAAKEAQQLMRLAQSKSSANIYPASTATCSQAKPTPPAVAKYLQGYRVTLSTSTFEINAVCGPNASTLTKDPTVVKSYTAPSGVTVGGAANTNFYTLNGGATATTFTFVGSNVKYRFSVTSTGAVSDVEKY